MGWRGCLGTEEWSPPLYLKQSTAGLALRQIFPFSLWKGQQNILSFTVILLPAPGGGRAGPGFLREFWKVPEPFLEPSPQGAPLPLREQLPEEPPGSVQPVGVTKRTP